MLVVDPNRRSSAKEILLLLSEVELPSEPISPRLNTIMSDTELPTAKGQYESHLESRRISNLNTTLSKKSLKGDGGQPKIHLNMS